MPALDTITDFYHKVLLESPKGEAGKDYLVSRGFTEETIKQFGIGFAPKEPVNYVDNGFLTYTELEALVEFKHLFKSTRAKYTDKFAGRLMFPVKDANGIVKGFAARTITDELPKYLNSAESSAYRKSRSLFGLDLAKEAIYAADVAILCEGYTDAMAFHQTGSSMAVACGGTYATKHQLALIARYTSKIYLAFDADEAGDGVTQNTTTFAKEMGLKVGNINIPRGKDPADVLLKSRSIIEVQS